MRKLSWNKTEETGQWEEKIHKNGFPSNNHQKLEIKEYFWVWNMGIENQQREPIGCPSRKNLWQDSFPLRVLLLVTLQSLEKSELLLLRGQMICRNSVSSSETRGVQGTGYKTRSIVETLSQLTPHETHFAFRGGMTDMLTYTNADTLTCNLSLSFFFFSSAFALHPLHTSFDSFSLSLSHSFLLPYLIFFYHAFCFFLSLQFPFLII